MSSPEGLAGGAEPHFCTFLWSSLTILCDGNVTCGLDDPHGQRNFGNVARQSVRDIWTGAAFAEMRQRLLRGQLCEDCTCYARVRDHDGTLGDPPFPYPDRLILESTIACNLRCDQSVCQKNYSEGFEPRESEFMSWETYVRLMDELGPHLTFMCFFNYGEPFMHSRAEDMLAHAKRINPEMEIITSTNGIPLSKESRARRIVELGLDQITFTIGGVRQEAYERYHIRGRLDLALRGMENVCRIKREMGVQAPEVEWRYLMFHWNDSDEEIDEAIALAEQIGVDTLHFHMTREPPGAASTRRAPGQPGHEKIRSMATFAATYHYVTPDEDGFYGWEGNPVMGSMRWVSKRAQLRLTPKHPWASLAIAVSDLVPEMTIPTVTLRTPLGDREVKPGLRQWRGVYLPVPPEFRDGREFPVELEVDQTLCPLEVGVGLDERHLGVMVRAGVFEDPSRKGFPDDEVDENGLYPPIIDRRLRKVRWTAPLARLRLRPRRGAIELDIAGCRDANGRVPGVTVITPWTEESFSLKHVAWSRVRIPVPRQHCGDGEIEIWLSVEATDDLSADPGRCERGVKIRAHWRDLSQMWRVPGARLHALLRHLHSSLRRLRRRWRSAGS